MKWIKTGAPGRLESQDWTDINPMFPSGCFQRLYARSWPTPPERQVRPGSPSWPPYCGRPPTVKFSSCVLRAAVPRQGFEINSPSS